jgi:hypothetical protein
MSVSVSLVSFIRVPGSMPLYPRLSVCVFLTIYVCIAWWFVSVFLAACLRLRGYMFSVSLVCVYSMCTPDYLFLYLLAICICIPGYLFLCRLAVRTRIYSRLNVLF